jgi:dephospho-CoA kinase
MKIGLTGGVGCGASEVARYLESKGIPVVSGDEAGHRALTDSHVREKLISRFGSNITDQGGEIDRSKLGSIVFADQAALQDLNHIIHTTLIKILKKQVNEAEQTNPAVIVDAALIYEWDLQDFFDLMIVVTASLDMCITRTIQRDGLSREQVLQRISAQKPVFVKAELADHIINNDGSLEDLYDKTDKIITLIPALQDR